MLITSDRKASFAKRVYMVCLFYLAFGASLTMIVDNPTLPSGTLPSGQRLHS